MEKIPQELIEKLDALAIKLGITVEHLWNVLTSQLRVEVFKSVSIAVILIFSTVICFKLTRTFYTEYKANRHEMWGFLATGIGVATGILFVFAIVFIGTTIGLLFQLMNPEYFALNKILGALR